MTEPHLYTISLLSLGKVYSTFFFILRLKMTSQYLYLTSNTRSFSTSLPSHSLTCLDRLGRVTFNQVLNLLSYMSNETETSPVLEALLQLNNIRQLLDKRQEYEIVARMKVHKNTPTSTLTHF